MELKIGLKFKLSEYDGSLYAGIFTLTEIKNGMFVCEYKQGRYDYSVLPILYYSLLGEAYIALSSILIIDTKDVDLDFKYSNDSLLRIPRFDITENTKLVKDKQKKLS